MLSRGCAGMGRERGEESSRTGHKKDEYGGTREGRRFGEKMKTVKGGWDGGGGKRGIKTNGWTNRGWKRNKEIN